MSSQPGGLSVAILAQDSPQSLDATLSSVREVASEVLVLDTGSSDPTREVATQNGACWHSLHWNDDFSAARNAVLDRVTQDWVLWLETGETLSPAESQRLLQFLQSEADSQKAYALLVDLRPPVPQEEMPGVRALDLGQVEVGEKKMVLPLRRASHHPP